MDDRKNFIDLREDMQDNTTQGAGNGPRPQPHTPAYAQPEPTPRVKMHPLIIFIIAATVLLMVVATAIAAIGIVRFDNTTQQSMMITESVQIGAIPMPAMPVLENWDWATFERNMEEWGADMEEWGARFGADMEEWAERFAEEIEEWAERFNP